MLLCGLLCIREKAILSIISEGLVVLKTMHDVENTFMIPNRQFSSRIGASPLTVDVRTTVEVGEETSHFGTELQPNTRITSFAKDIDQTAERKLVLVP